MSRATVRFAGVLAALLLCGRGAAALDVPPTPTTYFTDLAGVVPGDRAAGVESRLAAIEQSTGHQVIAVLFPSLEGESLEDFTIRCAERWKVGRKGLDDGVIFFAFLAERRMRLEVGYGLEDKVTDALASDLLADTVKPAFASGDYAGGVTALADALAGVFRGEPPPARRARSGRSRLSPLALIAVIVLIMLLRIGGGGGRRRRGGIFWGGFGGGFGGGSFGGGGGFSGGGGSFGGGGASGGW